MEWFKWFNYSCPFGENQIYVAEDQDKIIGAYGLLPYKIKFNDEVVDGYLCTNVCVLPAYQRQGIFINLGRFVIGDNKLALGVPNLQAIKGHLKVGWELLSNLDFIVSYNSDLGSFKSTRLGRFDKRFNSLLSVDKMRFAIVKDYKFLNWRYFDRPDKEYQVYAYKDADTVLGFIVLKYFEKDDYRKTHILDIYAINQDIFDDLITTAKTFTHIRNCNEINCWQIDNSIYADWFHKRGFELSTNRNVLIIRDNLNKIKKNNWLFMLGDNDVY